MVVQVYRHDVELSVLAYGQNLVVVVELAKIFAMVVEIDTQNVAVEPHLASTKG